MERAVINIKIDADDIDSMEIIDDLNGDDELFVKNILNPYFDSLFSELSRRTSKYALGIIKQVFLEVFSQRKIYIVHESSRNYCGSNIFLI